MAPRMIEMPRFLLAIGLTVAFAISIGGSAAPPRALICLAAATDATIP